MYKLKKISGERFVVNLFYASTQNHFYKDMYSQFGLSDALVLPELHDRLMMLAPKLQELGLRLFVYDAYRPVAAQRFMYDTAPENLRAYIARPPTSESKNALHTRGAALDCFLVREDGTPLKFPSAPDAFFNGWEKDKNYDEYLKRAHCDFYDANLPAEIFQNRALLQDLMREIGLNPLSSEWWHFSLPNGGEYPIIEDLSVVEVLD
ncbi:MAG: hypothetical protein LBB23_01985 [Rickettsiales bacterium]|jgi:D-alanyl-D-alanine dipeptidase|nr:hypothetical protein [Rickettsiales bacterium]